MQLRLPSTLGVSAGVASPLALGTALFGDVQPDADTVYTLDLGVSTGSLSGQSYNGLTDLDPVGGSVRLSGTVDALNAWLAAGQLVYTGQGETLSVTLARGTPAALASGTERVAGNITLSPSVSTQTPVVVLPGSISVAAAGNSPVVFPSPAFGTGSGVLTVTLSVATGSLGYSASSASFPVAGQALAVSGLVPAEGASGRYTSISFTGTATRLSQFFASELSLNARGAGGGAIQVAVARGADPAASTSRTESTVLAFLPSTATVTAPAVLSVPAAVYVTPDATSDVRLDGIDLSGECQLVLSIALPAALDLAGQAGFDVSRITAGTDVAAVSVSDEGRTVTLTGTSLQLETVLQGASRLRYTGPLAALTLKLQTASASTGLSVVSGIQLAQPAQPDAVRLSLPTAIYVTPGAPARVQLGNTPFDGAGTISIELEVERQFLTIDGVKPADAASAWADGNASQTIDTVEGDVVVSQGGGFARADGLTRTATRFSGTAEALNALFSTAGAVWYDLVADGSSVLRLRAAGAMESMGAIPLIGVTASTTTVAGPLAVTMVLPQRVTLDSAAQAPVKVAGAFSGGDDAAEYELELGIAAGSLVATSLLEGMTAASDTASSAAPLKLKGTIAQLNGYLASGGLRYSNAGAGAALSITLRGFASDGLTVNQVLRSGTELVPAIAALPVITTPSGLLVESGTSSPVTLAGSPLAGPGTLVLSVAVDAVDAGALDPTALSVGVAVDGVTLKAGATAALV